MKHLKMFTFLLLLGTLVSAHAKITKFGYFWSAIDEDDFNGAVVPVQRKNPNSTTDFSYSKIYGSGNYIREYSNHANVSWMIAFTDDGDMDQLRYAKAEKQMMVIDIAKFFHPFIKGKATKEEVEGMLSRWWTKVVVQNGFQDTIYFLTPHDEPFHIFGNKASVSQKVDEFAKIVKTTTGAKLGLTFHPQKASNGNLKVSPLYDYLGFYCYDADHVNDKCADGAASVPQILSRLEFKSPSRNDQKWYVIAPGSSGMKRWGRRVGLKNDQKTTVKRMNAVYEASKANPKVEMFISFLWRSLIEKGRPRFGSRDLPIVRARTTEIGKEILTGKSSSVDLVVTSSNRCSVSEYLKRRPDVGNYYYKHQAIQRRFSLASFVKYHWKTFGHSENWKRCEPN